jgi:alpha-L-arabinofuranosidase
MRRPTVHFPLPLFRCARWWNARRLPFLILPLTLLWLGVVGARAETTATVTVHADEPGALVSSNLFGVFFEEINYAGEGGLYAEMVRNRAFYDAAKPLFWALVEQGDAKGAMKVDSANPLNAALPHSLQLTMTSGSGSVGAANAGFWGMALTAGASYNLNLFARGADAGPLNVRLESADGRRVYAETSFDQLTAGWQRFSARLVARGTDANARLVVSLAQPGTVWLNFVSLFPQDTFHARANGLRADLAARIADLRPSFLRFPGGNFIESYNVAHALRWKTTVGDVAQRPGHFNDAWGYWSTDGLGAYEFFQFCEDAGMEPLYGINAGLMLNYNGAPGNTVPLNQLKPWVDDALDLIEYANGDTNTVWGARRAADGHPAPFNLKYLEVGNENGGSLFDERYTQFYDAIKARYPGVHIIAPGNWAGGPPWSRPVEIADEHYYASPATFIGYADKYDGYRRDGSKIFVGEYAVTSGFGTHGNLAAALGEAAFMTGIERNSDLVKMACYAPLFANVNGIQWHPDLIYYDNARSFCTPSYYVQQMFSQNRGEVVLPTTVKVAADSPGAGRHGAIGLGSWNSAVEYADVEVKSHGATLYRDDFAAAQPKPWRVFNGNWQFAAGGYKQTNYSVTDCRATTGDLGWADYTLTLKARKTGGSEGFLILFNWRDDDNWTWLNVGGWDNTKVAVEQCNGGAKTTLGEPAPMTIRDNTWYRIRIALSGDRIRCYINDQLVQDVSYPAGLFVSSTCARAAGQVILKAVNPYDVPVTTTFHLAGVDAVAPRATVVQLTADSSGAENSFARPEHVFPVTNVIANAGTNFTAALPANSLSVLRLRVAGWQSFTQLRWQLPAEINTGQTTPSVLQGQTSGAAELADLTANANHAISYDSANPAIAKVDDAGNVTGLAEGATDVTARYDSLGLAVTQSVRVINVPAQLVHRYRFNETAGDTCADSVGGSAWNGRLPAGGTFGGGQLTLAAASAQYVRLPAGILSNYPAVTVESWVTFPQRLPKDCFFFGFGDIRNGEGWHYLFCAPEAGRAAITDASYSREQNAYGSGDFSFCQNLHLTVVCNPPAGCLAVYTNGVLAGLNRNVTASLHSVHDLSNYIGRSLYAVDPYADLRLDEFRIYSGALTAAQIRENQALGPDKLPEDKLSVSRR